MAATSWRRTTPSRRGEAALTGESLPVTKDTAAIAKEVPLGDRDNMVFSGTAATYGHGKAVVIATGMRTEMRRIAGLLKETPDGSEREHPCERRLRGLDSEVPGRP
jgi:P-type Ca2+ transporter type 2C